MGSNLFVFVFMAILRFDDYSPENEGFQNETRRGILRCCDWMITLQ